MEGYKTPPTPPITGPGLIGHLAAIAVGAYTEIVEIIAPTEAEAGELVTVEVRVKNLYSDELAAKVGGWLDSGEEEIWLSPEYAWLDPGATYSFTYSFIMPNKGVHIDVWSYYWTGEVWYPDDYGSAYIALPVPEVYGTITRKELEYDEARADIPAWDIPPGKRGLVHIWGRNDISTSQKMGISWSVTDPDGVVVEEYYDWEAFSTGPGDEHEFIGGRFDLKPGYWLILVYLMMNPDNPVIVDWYNGYLCTVAEAAVPEPDFAGFGITEYTKQ